MNYLAFLLFTVACAVWLSLHLVPALWAVRALREEPANEIDMEFVRVKGYHARQISEGSPPPDMTAQAFASFPKQQIHGVVLSTGDCLLRCGTRAGAVVSTGELHLKNDVRIARFAHSDGKLTLGKQCRVEGQVTSNAAICIGELSRARSFEGTEVETSRLPSERKAPAAADCIYIPFERAEAGNSGLDPARLAPMAEDTWLYTGDLRPAMPVHVRCKLVVLGQLDVPPSSVFEDAVSVSGDIHMGAGTVCKSNVTSDGNIHVGECSRFEGHLFAAGDLRLGAAVRGCGTEPVVAYSRKQMVLAGGISVQGKLASGVEVVCIPE